MFALFPLFPFLFRTISPAARQHSIRNDNSFSQCISSCPSIVCLQLGLRSPSSFPLLPHIQITSTPQKSFRSSSISHPWTCTKSDVLLEQRERKNSVKTKHYRIIPSVISSSISPSCNITLLQVNRDLLLIHQLSPILSPAKTMLLPFIFWAIDDNSIPSPDALAMRRYNRRRIAPRQSPG